MRILMFQVKDDRITTQQIREKLYNMPRARNIIAARKMSFIGKVVLSPAHSSAQLMLTTCSSHKRRRGDPYFTNKDALVKNMELIFERVDKIHIDFVVRTHGGLVQRSKQLVILGATHQMPTEFS